MFQRGLCIIAFSTQLASGATFELVPDADARVIEIFGSGLETTNFETDFLSVFTVEQNLQRTLMSFSLNGLTLAPGERVSSATLSLQASTGFGGSLGRPTEVYKMIQPWTESAVTWVDRALNVKWNREGGDYIGAAGMADHDPYASNNASPQTGDRVEWDISRLVNDWVEGISPNYGLLLRSYDGNGLTFASSENANATARPHLTIVTAPGLPLMRAERNSTGGLVLTWRGQNVGVLEENTSASAAGWTQSNRPLTLVNGETRVVIPPTDARRFFRLRSP